MEKYKNRVITEGRNNMGMVRYCVVDRTNTPNAFCGGSFNTKKQGIEQLKRAKHLYPNHKWTLEAVFSVGGKEKKNKNLGDPLKESANNTNKSKNMNKKLIRLTENDLHRVIKESVNKILCEIGDTQRGQWMLGRLKNRQSNGGGNFFRGINYNDAGDYAYKANGNSYSDDFQQGYEDEGKNGRNADSTWDGNKYRRMQFNYDARKMSDMDRLGRKFIDFIEHYQGGALLQTIVDYETGNETGTPTSPLPTIIPEFEEAVVGHKCTTEMRKAIKAAYNQWWNYAEPMLTDNY